MNKMLALTIVMFAVCVPASAMQVDIPLPIVLGNSDMIVVAKVLEVGAPSEAELRLPDYGDKAHKGFFRTIKFQGKVHLGPGPTNKKFPNPWSIAVIAETSAPAAPAGPGPGGIIRVAPIVMDGPTYFNPEVGAEYVLVLHKLDDGKYYVPAYFKYFQRATEENVAAVKKLSVVDKWPWGKTVDGVQMACVVTGYPQMQNNQMAGAFVLAAVAVRNNSNKPVYLNLFDGDKTFQINATRDGKTVGTEFYKGLQAGAAWKPENMICIEPGKMAWIGPAGLARNGLGFALPLKDLGKYDFQAVYESTRDEKSDKITLWKGKLQSAPYTFELAPLKG